MIEGLAAAGCDTLFGYPGGFVLDIFDELGGSPIHFILARHEQGAVHMADGFARASGRVGCCLTTSGPGATNTVTGIPYAEDPTIFSWQICNEPRPFSRDEATVDGFCDWIWKAARSIKESDPNHMVSTGNEGAMGCNDGD